MRTAASSAIALGLRRAQLQRPPGRGPRPLRRRARSCRVPRRRRRRCRRPWRSRAPRSAKDLQLVLDQAVDRCRREAPVGAALARLDAGQDLDALVDVADRIDGELAVAARPPPRPRAASGAARWTCGISTPCCPFSPRARQTSKKPSIFSLTPPIACTSPHWLTEPVTASDCLIGTLRRAPRAARRARPTTRCRRRRRRRTARTPASPPAPAARPARSGRRGSPTGSSRPWSAAARRA